MLFYRWKLSLNARSIIRSLQKSPISDKRRLVLVNHVTQDRTSETGLGSSHAPRAVHVIKRDPLGPRSPPHLLPLLPILNKPKMQVSFNFLPFYVKTGTSKSFFFPTCRFLFVFAAHSEWNSVRAENKTFQWLAGPFSDVVTLSFHFRIFSITWV